MTAGSRSLASVLAPWLIVAAGLMAYANSMAVPFIFDDHIAIVRNAHLRHLWPPSTWLLAPPEAQPLVQRPVVAFSLAVNYALGGLSVWGYHAVNLAIHLLCALVLFGVVRRTLLKPPLADAYGSPASGLACAVSLLWVVHPLLTECVTYLTQRTEALMGLWYLLTLYAAIRSAESRESRARRAWAVAGVGACMLGMGSKQSMLTAPLVVMLYDAIFHRADLHARSERRFLYMGLAASWPVLAVVVLIGPPVQKVGFGLSHWTLWDNLATQPGIILHYLRLALWPHPLALTYDWPPAESFWNVAPAAIVIGGLLACTILAIRRRSPLGFVGGWFFLTLGPTSVWPMVTELVAERRMYLPLISVISMLVLAGRRALERLLDGRLGSGGLRVAAVAAIGALVVGWGLATRHRNEAYRDEVSIWRATIAAWPRNPRAHANLAGALLGQGQVDEAITHYQEAISTARTGRTLPGAAAPELHYNLGIALARQGRLDDAIAHYRQALRLQPDRLDARNNLALALADQGHVEEAIAELRQVVQLHPDDADARTNLGAMLTEAGHLDEAIAQYRAALRLNPDAVDAHNNLGIALMKQGSSDEAIAHFSEALRLHPDDAAVAQNLQEALATKGQPR